MKKITNRMISFAFLMCMGLFLFSLKVNAANNVTTINASGDTQGATVSGTTDDDVVAVLIEVLDGNNQVVTLETHAVTDGSYCATLSCTLNEGSTYSAYVVNYDGSGDSKRTTFTVPVSVTSVGLNKSSETITVPGGMLQLTATISPANASNRNVTWSTNNASVATVDQTGKVTAVTNGTATITVTTEDGNKTATATITVAVNTGTGGNGNTGGNSSTGSQGSSNTSTDNNNSSSDSAVKEEKVSVPIEYIVVKGDTLGRIARRNQMTLSDLLTLNPQIKNPNLIRPGQRITVGYAMKAVAVTSQSTEEKSNVVYYIVQRGDSLYKIAKRNKLPFAKLMALNPEVIGRRYIYPGQKIRVK